MQNKPLENQNTSTKSDKSTKSRRRLLLTLGGVTATAYLPSQWKKPLIDSIVVPAHAQATGPAQGETTTTTQEPLETIFSDEGIDANVPQIGSILNEEKNLPWYAKSLKMGVSNAKAGVNESGNGIIKFTTSANQELIEQIDFHPFPDLDVPYTFSGSVSVNEAAILLDTCGIEFADVAVTVNSINNNVLEYTIIFGEDDESVSGTARAQNIDINLACPFD